jgi:hypothetical protein
LAWNRYETLDSLEQATETIATTLVKCEFYHGLYIKFAQSRSSGALVHQKMFQHLEHHLPHLYAIVVEISFKAKRYFNPPGKLGGQPNSQLSCSH